MALLSEYAITPDVFNSKAHENEEVARERFLNLKDILLEEGLVRDLCDGAWAKLFSNPQAQFHPRGKELVKKLKQYNRLRKFLKVKEAVPEKETDWCNEALSTHQNCPINGIIATPLVFEEFKSNPIVASIQRLRNAQWWNDRSPSIRLQRTLEEYHKSLKLILDCANSLMFIDAYIEPAQQRYDGLLALLLEASSRPSKPLIEVHRVCYFQGQDRRNKLDYAEWKHFFRPWDEALAEVDTSAQIFIWDDLHDRYLISDLIGINLPNGFDTSTKPNDITTWTRLGRKARDDIQREFDPASSWRKLHCKFTIGAT